MKNHNKQPRNQSLKLVDIDGEYHVHDAVTNTAVPFDPSDFSHRSLVSQNEEYAPADSEDTKARTSNRRRYTMRSKVAVGLVAVSAIVLPPAAHVGLEKATFEMQNMLDPTDDRVITQDDLINDISVTVNRIMGKE